MVYDLSLLFPHFNAEEFDFLEMQNYSNMFEDDLYAFYFFIRDMLRMGFSFDFVLKF